MTAAIALEGLTKLYPGGQGVRDINLEVLPGEILGFIGKNGAGKSTTIRTALGLMKVTRGSAKLLGIDVHRDPVEARHSVGYVPSEPGVYDGMRVAEMLAYLGSFHRGRSTSAIETRRATLCEALDLDTSRYVEELSLGNKKKVALVSALQHQPRLLILDEPTSGLDPMVQASLFDLLDEERQNGTTVFFSSHVLGEVERICDRITIIKDGQLVETAELDVLRAQQAHRITAEINAERALSTELEGVSKIERDGTHITFLYRGALPNLLRALADDAVTDLNIVRPSLEELVIQHYAH